MMSERCEWLGYRIRKREERTLIISAILERDSVCSIMIDAFACCTAKGRLVTADGTLAEQSGLIGDWLLLVSVDRGQRPSFTFAGHG